jgi:hypothetical protein
VARIASITWTYINPTIIQLELLNQCILGVFKHIHERIQCLFTLIFYHRRTPFQDLEQCRKLDLLFSISMRVFLWIYYKIVTSARAKNGTWFFLCLQVLLLTNLLYWHCFPSSCPHISLVYPTWKKTSMISYQWCYKPW